MSRVLYSLAFFAFTFALPKLSEKRMSEFSSPPNNTPVGRVFVFGKPIYVRQPFVQPLRNAPLKRQAYGGNDYAPAPAPAPQDYAPAPTGYEEPAPPTPKYPLPQCYTNAAGYMCCNKELEKVIDDVYNDLNQGEWKNCNTQKIANSLQEKCQEKFGTDFETITGVGDFASKAHFYSDLICKTEKDGRVVLAYATPNRHNKPPPAPPAAYNEEPAPPPAPAAPAAPAGPYFTVRI
ncbi:unnamed protein product, partial [Mesorhabditis belari]|uniref:Ground-like domain-containing protein n=1 Tax=Mesorhabditis belari TaxID=2138241 RepID=A0AAF3EZY9_9BILA